MPFAVSDGENPTSDEISEHLGEPPRAGFAVRQPSGKSLKTEGIPFIFSNGENPTSDEISEYPGENPKAGRFAVSNHWLGGNLFLKLWLCT